MESHFTVLDWGVLAAYFVGTMAVGFVCRRFSRSPEGFTAADRSLPGWVCGLSIFAAYISSISFLALPGKAFATNWNAFAFSLSLPLATWIAVRWFLPYYRASGEVSAYAMLERRFGLWARMYASVCYLLTHVARAGLITYLMSLPLAMLLGWDERTLILLIGISVTIYSTVGGIVAVIWTDAFQSLVLIVGAMVCATVLVLDLPGGVGQLFEIAAAHHKFSLGALSAADRHGNVWLGTFSQSTIWVVLLYGLFTNLQNFGIDQSYTQRYVASRSDAEARQSVWLGGLLYVPVSAVFFFIGTALFAWYQTHPADLQNVRQSVARQNLRMAEVSINAPDDQAQLRHAAENLTDSEIGDKVFPYFIGNRLPTGIAGLLMAAILAAGMGSISASLNSSATLMLYDYYQRLINPAATPRQTMFVLHAGTIVVGVLGTCLAWALPMRIESALDTWWTLASAASGGMVGLFLLGMISRRASNRAAILGTACGLMVMAWMLLSPTAIWPTAWADFRSPFHSFMIIVVGTSVILFVGLAVRVLEGGRGRG